MQRVIRTLFLGLALLAPLAASADTLKLRPVLTVVSDDKSVQLKNPEGVGCFGNSFVVADSGNGRLVLYTLQDKILKGGTEVKVPQVSFPIEVQMGPKGEILVLDGKLRKIAQLTPQGSFVSFLDPQGVPEPATIVPRAFKVDGAGNFYLLDIYGERVVVLNASGKYVNQIPFPKPHGFFSSLALKPNGDVLLLDSVASAVYVSRKSGATYDPFAFFAKNLGEYLNFATYITTDRRGVSYIVDHNGGALISLGQDGVFMGRQLSLGWKPGLLFYPSQICITAADEILVADRNNSIVQLFEIMK